MAIFKRFEVWLLLLLSMAGVGYVLWSESQSGSDPEGSEISAEKEEAAEEKPRFEIRAVRAVPEGDDEVIEIDLAGTNDTAEPLELIPPAAKLVARYDEKEDSAEVPSFFLPFDPPPTLEPNSHSIVTLKYWLQPKSGNDRPALTLEVDGESLALNF